MGKGIIVGLAGLLILGIGGASAIPHLDRETHRVQVTEKERIQDGEDSRYLVFSQTLPDSTVRVFENTDSFLEWKFNSSDIYAEIKEGEKYDIKTYGWRVPFLSMYENILKVTPVTD